MQDILDQNKKKELVNCQWILHRALYLTWVAKRIQDNKDLVQSLQWVYQFGSSLRPILQVIYQLFDRN